jgi:dihydroxyacetone kinase DhaKLM complex PTS-EIIA-like component DhaM
VLAKAAEFARAEAAPSLLVGEIALVRGAVAAASEQWEQADLQLRLATEVTKRSF